MAEKTRLRIVTPSKILYDDYADMVIMRTTSGDIGVLHGHQPLTTTLSYGILQIQKDGEETLKATVFGGFANIKKDSVTILSDAAEWPDDIDVDRAEASKERAEKRISSGSDIDVMRAELSLKRALLRLEIKK
jgi:F-type H+-transporting ATPase subunit epsilon